MKRSSNDEWALVERLLPKGWRQAAHRLGAFQRPHSLRSPASLLRVLLFHAVSDQGLRESALELRVAGVARLSHVALFKRFRSAAPWLSWIAQHLCVSLRDRTHLPSGYSWRVLDGTTLQPPGTLGAFRLHYAIDLLSLGCDWHQLTSTTAGEALARLPLRPNDVVIADRNFLTPPALRAAREAQAFLLFRMRWAHPKMWTASGRRTHALSLVRGLRLGRVGQWKVALQDDQGQRVRARLIAVKLPLPLAKRAQAHLRRKAQKKQRRLDPRSLQAARYVLLLTTLPARVLSARRVAEAYRFRWQVEVAFKRLRRLLRLGQMPHHDPEAAQGWIHAKLVAALLLERLYREAQAFSPWGYPLARGQ